MTRTRTRFQAIICLLLVFCMLLSSCGKNKGDDDGDDSGNVGTSGENTGDTGSTGNGDGDGDGDGGTTPCSHATTALVGKKDPTCSEKGYTGDTVCTACTAVVTKGSDINMTEHSFDTVGKVTKEPTCISTGVKTFTCEGCGTIKTEPIDTVAHKDVYHDVKDGTHFHTCRSCTLNENQAHVPTDNGTPYAASCLEPAYVEYTCRDCKGVYKVYVEGSEALGHDFGEGKWVVTKEATCKAAGVKSQSCERDGCGYANEIEIPKKAQCDMVFNGYQKEPTCVEAGEAIYVCRDCGKDEIRPVSATGIHNYVEDGSDENWIHKTCSFCYDTISSYVGAANQTSATIDTTAINTEKALEMEMEKAAIQFPSDVVSQITEGDEVSISADAAEETKLNETIDKVTDNDLKDALQNTTVYDFTVKVGDEVFKDNFSAPVMITLPYDNNGQDADGIVIYYLAEDGKIDTITNVTYDDMAKTVTFFVEHFSYYAVAFQETQEMKCKRGVHAFPETPNQTVTRTCYTYGYEIYVCPCCHTTSIDNIVEKLDHNLGDLIEAKPTCDSGDYSHKICQNPDCGYVELYQFKGATGHAIDAPATCTTPATCTKCNNVVYRALGHSWTEWEIEVKPTEVTNGLRRRYCTVCGEKEEVTLAATGNIETITYDSYEELMSLVFDKILKLNSGSLAVALTAPGGSEYTVNIKVKKTDNGYTALMNIPAALTGVMDASVTDDVVVYYNNGVFVADVPEDAIYSSSMDNINTVPIEIFKATLTDIHAELNYFVENYIKAARALFADYAPIVSAEIDAVLAAAGSEFTVAEIEGVIDSVETVYAYISLKLGYATNAEIIEGITLPETKDIETIVSAFMTLTEGEGGTKIYTFDLTKITDALNTVADWLEEKSGETIAEFVYGLVGEELVEINEDIVDFGALVDFVKTEVPGTLTIADAIDKLLGLLEDNEIVTIDSIYNLIDELAYKMSGQSFSSKTYVAENGTAALNDMVAAMTQNPDMTLDTLYEFVKEYAEGAVVGELGYMGMSVSGIVDYAKSMLESIKLVGGATFVFDADGKFVSFELNEDLQMQNGTDEVTEEPTYASFEKATVTVSRDDNIVIEIPANMAAGLLDVKQSYDADGNLIIEGLDDSFDIFFDIEGYGEFEIEDIITKDEELSAELGYTVYKINDMFKRRGEIDHRYFYVNGKYYKGEYVDITVKATATISLTALISDPNSFIPDAESEPDGYIEDNENDMRIPAWDIGVGVAYQYEGEWMFAAYKYKTKDYDEDVIIFEANIDKAVPYAQFASFVSISHLTDEELFFGRKVSVDGEEYRAVTVYYYTVGSTTSSKPAIVKNNEIILLDEQQKDSLGGGYYELTEVASLPARNGYKIDKHRTNINVKENGVFVEKDAIAFNYCIVEPVYFVKIADGLYSELNSYVLGKGTANLPGYITGDIYTAAYETASLPDGNTLYIKGRTNTPDENGLTVVYGYAKTADGLYIQTICRAKGEEIVEVEYREASGIYRADYEEVYYVNDYVTKTADGKYKISKTLLDTLKSYCVGADRGFYITIEAEKTVDGQKYSNMYNVACYSNKPDVSLEDIFGGFGGVDAESVNMWEYYFGYNSYNNYEFKLNDDGTLTIYFAGGSVIKTIEYSFGNRFPVNVEALKKADGDFDGLDVYKLEASKDEYHSDHYVYENGKYYEYSTFNNYDFEFIENAFSNYYVKKMNYQFDTLAADGLEEGIPVYETVIAFRTHNNWPFYGEYGITVYTLVVDGKLCVATQAELTGSSLLKFEQAVPLSDYMKRYVSCEKVNSTAVKGEHQELCYNGVKTTLYHEAYKVYEILDSNTIVKELGQVDCFYIIENGRNKYVYDFDHLAGVIEINDEYELPAGKYTGIKYEPQTYYNKTVTMAVCSYTERITASQYFVKLAGNYYRYDSCNCANDYKYFGCYWCVRLSQDDFNNSARDKVWYYALENENGQIIGFYSEFGIEDGNFVPMNETYEIPADDMINMLPLGYTADGNMLYEVSFYTDTAAGVEYTVEELADGTVYYHVNGVGYLKDQSGYYIPARKMLNADGEYEIVCRIHSAYVNDEYLDYVGVLDAFVETGIGKGYVTISPEFLEIAKANRNQFYLRLYVSGNYGSGQIRINYEILKSLFNGELNNNPGEDNEPMNPSIGGGTVIKPGYNEGEKEENKDPFDKDYENKTEEDKNPENTDGQGKNPENTDGQDQNTENNENVVEKNEDVVIGDNGEEKKDQFFT